MIWATLLFLISSYIHIPPENLAAVLKLIMQEQVASIDALISLDYICPCSLLKKTLYTLFLDPLYFLVLSHSIFSFFFLGSRTSSLWLWLGACPQVYPLSPKSHMVEGILFGLQLLPAMAQLTLQEVQGHVWFSFS